MGQRRSLRTFLSTFLIIFMLGISIEVFSQVINSIRATNVSQLVVDNNNNGLADGGDVIQYTVEIANCSGTSIGGVNYQSDLDPNTSLVPNSVQVTTSGTSLCGDTSTPVDPPPPPPPPPANPIVTTTTPADGATEVAVDTNLTITFSEAVTVTGDWVEMVCTTSGTFNPVALANLVVTGGPITYTLDPNIDLQVGETCAVTVYATGVVDTEALSPLANFAFSFVTETPPTVTTTSPANGAVGVATTDDIVITFDEPVTVTAASFTLECPATVPFAGGFAVSGSGTNIITVNPTGNLPAGTSCEVVIIAANTSDLDPNDPPDLLDGNGDLTPGDDYTFSFTTDVDAAPFVQTINPADGAVSVPNTTNITITFSELVDISSAADFGLECGGVPQGYTVTTPATLPASTTTVVITPAGNLPDAETCQVAVFTTVTDTDANDPPNNMVANFISTFTTEAPPAVTTTTPTNGATGVSSGTNIVVNFDEPVNVTLASFTIVCTNGGNRPFTVTGDGTNSITLDPATNLQANDSCTVTVVANQVSDVDPIDPPNNMVADYVFSFDTVADTAPTVLNTTPADLATGVPTASNIVINFSEPVDVTAGAFTLECASVGVPFTVIPALPITNQTSFTLDPTGNLPATSNCVVTVFAINVTDTDTDEPPDNMAADYTFSFATLVDLAPTVNQPAIVPASTSTGANSASLDNPVSTTPTITIPFSEAVDVASGGFTLVCNASPIGVTITPALPNTNQTSFDVSPSAPIAQGANCVLTVVATNVTDTDVDDPPNLMVTNFTLSFSVDTAPAEILTETEVGGVFQDVTGAGATNVDLDSTIQISFNEAVTVTFPANGLQCPAGNNIPVTIGGNGTATITLTPTANLPLNTACVLNIPAGNISDVDTADAPDTAVAGVNHTFQTANDNAPTVTTNPATGGANIATNSNITVTFSEAVTLTGGWFALNCSISGNRISTGELTGTGIVIIENTPDLVYTIDPTVDFASGDVCTITINSANVVDNDPIDPPNNLDGDASGDVLDDADNYVAIFSTTDIAPSVVSTTPLDGVTVANNQAVTLNFSELVSLSNVPGTGITWVCNATPVTYTVGATANITSITLTPTGTLPNGSACTVTVNDVDVSDDDPIDPPNNMLADFFLNFTVDAQPTVVSTQVEVGGVLSPASGAVNVDIDTNIVVTFSEPVTVTLASFDLECPAGNDITFTIAGSGTNTITIDPTPATLPINTLCDLDIIAVNVSDVDVNDPPDTMPANINLTFTTVDDNPPSVTSAEAEIGGVFTALPFAGFADPNTDLRVTFSEAVTVTGNWAELDCTISGTQDVALGLAVTDADPVYTFNPATDLTPGESCTLTIFALQVDDDDIIDPPTNMTADVVFTFTVQDTAPRVINTVPASFDITPNNQTLTINFTEAVDIAAGGISWTCGTPVTFTPALPLTNVTSVVLTPTTTLTPGICTVFLESTLITDVDTVDAPNELDGDYSNDLVDGDADDYSFNFVVDAPPQVNSVTVAVSGVPTFLPLLPAQRADLDTNIVVNFNENINASVASVVLECNSIPVPFTGLPVANNNVITLNPTANLPGGATCIMVLIFTDISDSDAFDPPNLLDGDNDLIEGPNIGFLFQTQAIANDDAYTVTPHLTYTSPTGVRANDQPNTTTITGFGDSLPNANANPTGSAVAITGGTVVLNADGTFIFYPIAGFSNTSTSFFYTITGGDTAQVTINVQNQEFVWFVDNSPTAPPAPFVCSAPYTGTQACPSADLATVSALDTTNDTIFVAQGSYICQTTLETGERVVGDGATSDLATISGVTPVAGSSFPAFTGTDPILTSAGNCLTLSSNNEVRGLRIDNTAGFAIASAFNIGTSSASEVNVTGTGGMLNLSGGGTFNGAFETLSSSSHNFPVIALTNISGTITNTGGTITSSTPTDIIGVNGGSINMTLLSTVSKTGGIGRMIAIAGGHTGTLTFEGAINNASPGGDGIVLDNADGTYTFNGDVDLLAGTAGVNIQNGSAGTVNISNALSNIENIVGISFRINNSTANVTYAGQIIHTPQTSRGIEIIQGTGTISFSNTLQIGTVGSPMLTAVGVFLDATGNINPISFSDLNIITGTGGGASSQAFVSQTSGRIAVTTGNIDCNGNIGAGNHCFDVSDTISNGVTFASFLSDHDDAGEAGGSIFLNNTPGTFTFQNFIRMTGFNTIVVQATNFGTLNVGTVSTGQIALNGATAVNIDNGAINFNATAISMFSGAANGIVLTDTTGSFTVRGDGNPATHTNGAGGTISNTTDSAIVLDNVTNITLNDMIINNTGNHAIFGTEVNGLVLDNVDMTDIGNADNEYGLNFSTGTGANLVGTVIMDNVTMTRVADDMVYLENFSGNLNLTVTESIFDDTISTTACGGGNCNGAGLLIRADQTSTMDIRVEDNQFLRIDGTAINANPEGNSGAVMEIDIITNIFTANVYGGPSNTNNGETAISLRNAQGNSTMRFDVNGNQISNYSGELALGVIEVEAGDFTVSNGAIRNNTINHAYDGNVIALFVDGASTVALGVATDARLNVSVTGNTVPASPNIFGVSLIANNNGAITANQNGTLNLIATNNNFNANATGTARRTITINIRERHFACMDMRLNTLAAGTGGTQPSINVSYNGTTVPNLQGMMGLGDANAIAYLNANNTLAVGAISGPNDNIVNGICTVPSYP